jgi:hypothetical protein
MNDNYQLFLDHLQLFNATDVKAKDTGEWSNDHFTDETHFPVPSTWMPGGEDNPDSNWWFYHPNDDKTDPTFAGVLVYKSSDDDADTWLSDVLADQVENKDGYKLGDKNTYYGEKNEWKFATFTHDGENGEEITGRIYVTIKNSVPYVLWFEAPTDKFNEEFATHFTIMLDGFRIDDTNSDNTSSSSTS